MNNPKALKIVIALLVVALFTSFGFLAYAIHQSHEWKYVVWLQDGRIAAYRALGDFSRNHAVGISSGERNLAARPLIEMFLSLICRHQTVGKTDCNAIGFCSVTGCHFICCVVYFGQFTGSTAWFRFRAGNLRLFIISGERGHDVFSGTNDGPFQVWFRQYGTQSYSPSLRYSIEDEIRDYNHEMRNLQQHPEKLLGLTNVMTP